MSWIRQIGGAGDPRGLWPPDGGTGAVGLQTRAHLSSLLEGIKL